jgi:4'-phosphopantetheinyl transferase
MSEQWIEPHGWPALARNEAHIWLAYLPSSRPVLEQAIAILSVDEQERMGRFRFETHRQRSTLTRGILRWILGHYAQTAPGQIEFIYGRHGKPALASGSLCFNTSHSGDYAAFAITQSGDIGVDIEQVRGDMTRREEIARRHFASSEYEELLAVPESERTRAFFELWTRKEAFIKARGDGLFSGLQSFAVSLRESRVVSVDGDIKAAGDWRIILFPEVPDYCGAAVVRSPASVPMFWKWNAELLRPPPVLPATDS